MVGAPEFKGLLEEPFKVYFQQGRIVKISEGKDAKRLKGLLDTLEDQARTFAELGVNSNHKIPRRFLGTRTDNAILEHVHIGLGRNDHIGGKSSADAHLDLLMKWATLLLDGRPILEDGVLKISKGC